MSNRKNDKEKNIRSMLIIGLENMEDTPTIEDVERKAKVLAYTFNYEGNLRNIIEEAMISVDTRMGSGTSLVDSNTEHDDRWIENRNIDWSYSNAYKEFLRKDGWPPQIIQSLNDVTLRTLSLLQDPQSDGAWSRRGMVIGNVQSGKTANYTGLIARSADAGYKFIIVIAGIHNNLRKQTQERIDEAFIGRTSDPNTPKSYIGVGLTPGYKHPATLTNIYEDFNSSTAAKMGWQLNDFSKPIILIIKKNVRTLESLHNWLKNMNAKGGDQISDVPMLMIDDEADNASINTNKDDLSPTKTNAGIRGILRLFAKSCYVGYTATPFANIFINPDAYDKDVREDLFPKDFIYCLDAPTNYFGAEKIFINETSSNFLRKIDDCEEFIPFSHKRDHEIYDLPPSLYNAVNQFLVARAIRNLRGHSNKHCSMMINVSRFVDTQRQVKNHLSLILEKTKNAVQNNYAMPEDISKKDKYMQQLKKAFDSEYSYLEFSWHEVKSAMNDVFKNLRLFIINSKSDEALDYKRYDDEAVGLTAIAVGGLSLSRGLTIEGLTVSYLYRNTKMYDTLMQMGRWFGYRPNYEDLCRIHLSPDSINWYSHIAEASEELVEQVKTMRRDNLSPSDFGLYVRSHPDSLLITAKNKMGAGEEVVVQQSFSGRLRESYILSTDEKVNLRNFALISEFWKSEFKSDSQEETGKGVMFKDVPIDVIDDFLTRFECHSKLGSMKGDVLKYLRKISRKHSKADVLLISPQKNAPENQPFILNAQYRAAGKDLVDGKAWSISRGRVASRGDEKLGLNGAQIELAKGLAKEGGDSKKPSDYHYRAVRNKPLLMLHSLAPNAEDKLIEGPIAAFGISFPDGDYSTTIEVVANKIWLQQQMQFSADDIDGEEEDE